MGERRTYDSLVTKKVVLAVVDGLGPELLDRAIAAGRAPTIAALAAAGSRTDTCVSTFPSLTPVCLSAIVTGEHPVGSRIPGMTWYHHGEGRFVEYGSSFAATLAEGTRQMIDDILVNLNLLHLSPRATTVFEALEDAGLDTAAVNLYVCRGRVRHRITRPAARRFARTVGIVDAVYGPRRYFLGDLFFSDLTGAPRNFGHGIDRHGGAVARWLVTRDGFDFLFLYLYETDAAGHRGGDVLGAVERADNGLALMAEAAGGLDRFLDRYGVIVLADHSQSRVEQIADVSEPLADLRLFRSSRRSDPDRCDVAVAASNRAAMAYLLPGNRVEAGEVAGQAGRSSMQPMSSPTATATGWRCGAATGGCGSGAARGRPTSAATAGRSRAMPACSTPPSTRTRSSGSRGRSGAPPPATSSSRPRPAGSSPTPAASTTWAAAATARSGPRTRSSRS